MTSLSFYANCVNPTVDYATEPSNYYRIYSGYRLIWSNGSSDVYDRCGYSPTEAQLNAAANPIRNIPTEVKYCFYNNYSDLIQVKGANSGNNRYVFLFRFTGGDTATEPTLEAWDDSNNNSANLSVLGSGIPTNSMIHAICTTDSLPGGSWFGTPLAGSNVILLNNGNGSVLNGASLYANIYIKIPAGYSTAEISNPVLSIRWTYQ